MTAAILLAAGESARMGRPKPLLPWRGLPLVEYQVRELAAADIDQVIVVLGHDAGKIRQHVPAEARIVVNEAYSDGRASSLRAGAAALADDVEAILVLNVDQPRPRDLLQVLLTAHAEDQALITVPTFAGKRGHPIVLSNALLGELHTANEETRGLHGVIEAHRDALREVAVASEIVLLDLNTSEEYEQALARFGSP